jgi:hypothetical protein
MITSLTNATKLHKIEQLFSKKITPQISSTTKEVTMRTLFFTVILITLSFIVRADATCYTYDFPALQDIVDLRPDTEMRFCVATAGGFAPRIFWYNTTGETISYVVYPEVAPCQASSSTSFSGQLLPGALRQETWWLPIGCYIVRLRGCVTGSCGVVQFGTSLSSDTPTPTIPTTSTPIPQSSPTFSPTPVPPTIVPTSPSTVTPAGTATTAPTASFVPTPVLTSTPTSTSSVSTPQSGIVVSDQQGVIGEVMRVEVRLQDAPAPVGAWGMDLPLAPELRFLRGGVSGMDWSFGQVSLFGQDLIRAGAFRLTALPTGVTTSLWWADVQIVVTLPPGGVEIRPADLLDDVAGWTVTAGRITMGSLPTPSASPTVSPTSVVTPTPSATMVPSPTGTLTPTLIPTATRTPTSTVSPTLTPSPTGSTPTAAATATPTRTAVPTQTGDVLRFQRLAQVDTNITLVLEADASHALAVIGGDIGFDPSVLRFVRAEVDAVISGWPFVGVNLRAPGQLRFGGVAGPGQALSSGVSGLVRCVFAVSCTTCPSSTQVMTPWLDGDLTGFMPATVTLDLMAPQPTPPPASGSTVLAGYLDTSLVVGLPSHLTIFVYAPGEDVVALQLGGQTLGIEISLSPEGVGSFDYGDVAITVPGSMLVHFGGTGGGWPFLVVHP